MNLCDRCQRFDIQEFTRARTGFCGYPLGATILSARSGCLFCTLLLQQFGPRRFDELLNSSSISWFVPSPWIEFSPVRGQLLGEATTASASLNLKSLQFHPPQGWIRDGLADKTTVTLHVGADEGTPARISNDVTGKITIQSSLSISDLPLIRPWFEDCYENHPTCRLTLSRTESIDAKRTKLPARLVKIQFINNRDCVKLSLEETEGRVGSYVALSHRWDDQTFVSRTTKANYACRQALCGHSQRTQPDCPGTAFPPLYHDAGLIAHNLGVSYIWIDSVCIVQDDADDWKKESARMADYYQHAWLTIASTVTADDGGLLNMAMEPQDVSTIVGLPYRDRSGAQRGCFYVQASLDADVRADYLESVGPGCEFRHRGWIFQEFILSRRLLAFSKRGGVYKICQTRAPENTAGDPVGRVERAGFLELPRLLRGIMRTWEDLMEKYCTLRFTMFEQDRVLALSGVAKEFEKALRMEQQQQQQLLGLSNDRVDFSYGHFFVWGEPEGPEISLGGLLWQEEPAAAESDDGAAAEAEESESGKKVPGEKLRALGVPTWSWASVARRGEEGAVVGMKVRWFDHDQKKGRESGDQNVARLKAISPTPGYILQSSDAPPPGSGTRWTFTPAPEYRDHNPLRALEICGRLHQCKIYGFFGSDREREAAAHLTYRDPKTAPAKATWRRVVLGQPAAHQYVIGWASVESPDDQEFDEESCTTVEALFIRRMPGMAGGYGWGHWTNRQTAFEVLFLRPLTGTIQVESASPCYTRVGMGRLFGDEVEACYKGGKDTDIILV